VLEDDVGKGLKGVVVDTSAIDDVLENVEEKPTQADKRRVYEERKEKDSG